MIFQVTIANTRSETRVYVAEGVTALDIIRKGIALFDADIARQYDLAREAATAAGTAYKAPERAPIAEVHLAALPVSGMFQISKVVPFPPSKEPAV